MRHKGTRHLLVIQQLQKWSIQQKTFLMILSRFAVWKHYLVLLPDCLPTLVNVNNVFRLIFLRLISHHSIPLLLTLSMTFITFITYNFFHCLNAKTHSSLEEMQGPSRYGLIRKSLSFRTHRTWYLIFSQTFACL